MADTTTHDHGYHVPRTSGRRASDKRRVNWSAVAWATTVAIWILGALSGWFGTNALEIKSINERLGAVEYGVQQLKDQRVEDLQRDEQQRQEILKRMDRQEDKLDQILRWVK
jgi:hypothetical protein